MKHLLLISILFLSSLNALAAHTPGQWQQEKFGDTRYFVYLPSGYNENEPAALMLNLHGCSQNAEDLVKLGNWKAAADTYNMVVAVPQVPNGGVVFGCWDYYGKNHTETNRHNGSLIKLTEFLVKESGLAIDQRQIYVSGLSSGATQAAILGCMRPDLFAGVGINSGPTIGTDMNEMSNPKISVAAAAQFCRDLAGARADLLNAQVTSIIVSDSDGVVNPKHSALSFQVMAEVYGARAESKMDLSKLPGTNTRGQGKLLADADDVDRVSIIVNAGLGHAWAAGGGSSTNPRPRTSNLEISLPLPMPMPGLGSTRYVNSNSVNYPMFLGKFFSENNKRLQERN